MTSKQKEEKTFYITTSRKAWSSFVVKAHSEKDALVLFEKAATSRNPEQFGFWDIDTDYDPPTFHEMIDEEGESLGWFNQDTKKVETE